MIAVIAVVDEVTAKTIPTDDKQTINSTRKVDFLIVFFTKY